jgi:hypothetical protein
MPDDFYHFGCFQAPSVKGANFFLFPPRPTNDVARLDGVVLGSYSWVSEQAFNGSNIIIDHRGCVGDGFFVRVSEIDKGPGAECVYSNFTDERP